MTDTTEQLRETALKALSDRLANPSAIINTEVFSRIDGFYREHREVLATEFARPLVMGFFHLGRIMADDAITAGLTQWNAVGMVLVRDDVLAQAVLLRSDLETARDQWAAYYARVRDPETSSQHMARQALASATLEFLNRTPSAVAPLILGSLTDEEFGALTTSNSVSMLMAASATTAKEVFFTAQFVGTPPAAMAEPTTQTAGAGQWAQ